MPSIGGLAGGIGSTAGQIFLYSIIQQAVAGLLAPEAQALANIVWGANPTAPLSPAELALAVIRGERTEEDAAPEAAQSGTSADRFHTLVRITGQAPAPQELAIALRRKIIDAARFTKGIEQGNLRDEWEDVIRALSIQQPSPEAMLQAELEGQLPHAEALARYVQLGGDPDYYGILFDTQGQAPSPVEALTLANRGIIGWSGTGPEATTYEQAFLEGPWRNKWLEPFRALGEYLPPPRTVTAMMREGSLTAAEGADLLHKQGLSDALVGAYVSSATSQATQATKDLSQTTIVTLYADQLVDAPTATAMLRELGYSDQSAGFILAVADLQVAQRYINAAVGRVHTLYIAHKLSRDIAGADLAQLGVPASQVTGLLSIWDYERSANVKLLTPAEIAGAYKATIIDQGTAQAYLEGLGYQPHDAWVYLSTHAKAKLPDEPSAGATAQPVGP